MHALLMLAAEGDHESAGVMDANLMVALTTLVVFIIVLVVLYIAVWPKITKGLDDRANKIRAEIAAAEAAREKASAAQAEYEASLSEARQEASEMIARAKADAKAVAEELRSRNETELAEMKHRATREIESAKKAAITEIHAEATNLASSIAGKILQREIAVEDQQRMVDEALAELAQVSGQGV